MEGFFRTNPNLQVSSLVSNTSAGARYATSGLEMYLDAGLNASYSGSGTTWFDLSGNNRNCTWVSTPNYTSGDIPFFSTLGNRCVGPASNSFNINNSSGYTITIAMMQNTLVATGAFKFYSTNGTGNAGRGIFAHLTWSDNVIYFDQGGCCNPDTRTSVASGGSQTWNLWTLRKSNLQRHIFKNNALLTTNITTAANINLSSAAADIVGSDEYGGNSSTWNARIATFMVYSRALTDAEVAQNFEAFRSRFSL